MKLGCANDVKFEFSNCLPPCSGLIVSSFSKTDTNKILDDLIYNEIISYDKFTRWTEFPEGLKGFQIDIDITKHFLYWTYECPE